MSVVTWLALIAVSYLIMAFLSATLITAIKKYDIKIKKPGRKSYLDDEDKFDIGMSAAFAPIGLAFGLGVVLFKLSMKYGESISDSLVGINEKEKKNAK